MRLPAYVLGTVSAVLFIVGALFKIQHWPGAGIALTAGLCLMAIAVPVCAIYHYRKNE